MKDETLINKRKRLIFRSWHRGTREMDLIMGSFAEAHVPQFDEAALLAYETLLETPDPDLYDWVSGRVEVPANNDSDLIQMLIKHDFSLSEIARLKAN
jgi:antitoxin CptB